MGKLWERAPGETDKAFAAFRIYRDLGPEKRSLEAVATKVAKKALKGRGQPTYIKEWSSQNKWVERASAYDDHLDEVRRAANERAIAEMSRKHAEGMRKIFDKGLKRIDDLEAEKIQGGLALELTMSGMKGERLARGLTTDSIGQTVSGGEPSRPLADAIAQDPVAYQKAIDLINAAQRRTA